MLVEVWEREWQVEFAEERELVESSRELVREWGWCRRWWEERE